VLPGVSGTLLVPTFLEQVLLEEIATEPADASRFREIHRWWRSSQRKLGPAVSVRTIVDAAAVPFFEAAGFRVVHLEPAGDGFSGLLRSDAGSVVALRVAPWGTDPGREWRSAVCTGRIIDARWGLVFTGSHMRVVDARRPWSRRSVEFDLAAALTDERSLRALMGVVRATGASGTLTLDRFVERADHHGQRVCTSLSTGVLDALSALYRELDAGQRGGGPADRAVFEQAITIVYRLLFLLFAEARAMVPTWHPTYRASYTVDALCRRALANPERRGLWKALQAISRLAHYGCRAGDLVVTPFNGRLFAPAHTPLANRVAVSDAIVGRAVIALATTRRNDARERIAYGDLGVEQLGAVYERVLEYEPVHDAAGSRLARTAVERKSSGSFYTPRSITDFLVRRALAPLIEGRTSDQLLQLRVLDPAMGSGAFLVAACRYLGDAVEHALIDEGGLPGDCTRDEKAGIRRLVAQRCLFGVDLNPTAVQLTRLSLWLATLSADKPLTFLDHHLTTGDSLAGASLIDLTRMPFAANSRRRDTPTPLFPEDSAEDLARHVLPERFRIASEPGDTAAAVRAKEQALSQISAAGTPLARWKDAADLWCAAWFWKEHRSTTGDVSAQLTPGIYHDLLAMVTGRHASLPSHHQAAFALRVRAIANAQRFFHWELEFPEVFFAANGRRRADAGFDAILGNPPWEVMRADTGGGRRRQQARADHLSQRRFFRDSGIYRHQSAAHTNRYQLFLERALQLTRPQGRIAMIVPSGFAMDQGSARLRRALLDDTCIERLIGFDNHQGIFPIHRDVRFLLLTATKGPATDRLICAFGQSDASWLDRLPDAAIDDPPAARPIVLSRRAVEAWDPAHLTLPWFSRRDDVEITAAISSRTPALADIHGWEVTFGRELNATDDRAHFKAMGALTPPAYLPIVEGKHLEPFRVCANSATLTIAVESAARIVNPARSFARARLGYRDVASATNRLTLIAARLPPGTISTHTVFCSRDALGADSQYCLLALLNSLVANYLVRLRVTTHVTAAVMARLPVPRPPYRSTEFHELATLASLLEGTGVDGHDHHYARLNAVVAKLYGLTRAQYEYILSTFPLLPRRLTDRAAEAFEL
jgi:hypothetical protein